ncbi:MAG TPA: class I SAM-dependent methyltransferase [Polyangiaceae bacterium]|nr:class I SAM-dependent methyltransferase [Polyangiaceae bacterium]
MSVDLPYFDDFFDRLAQGPDSHITRVFQRHLHWGYFARPVEGDVSDETFLAGAEAMTEHVSRAAGVADGQRILEVGCGFGGTIAHMNDRLSNCHFVGLNIDERQVRRARELVTARPTNDVRFVVGDACKIPFPEASFDVVMAVECIFHFPSRRTFLTEARRVLRTGGTLMVSDFIANARKFAEMSDWMEANPNAQGTFFGSMTPAISSETYAKLGRAKRLELVQDEDITVESMPTYPWMKRVYAQNGLPEGVKTVSFLEELTRRGFFEYRVLTFRATA